MMVFVGMGIVCLDSKMSTEFDDFEANGQGAGERWPAIIVARRFTPGQWRYALFNIRRACHRSAFIAIQQAIRRFLLGQLRQSRECEENRATGFDFSKLITRLFKEAQMLRMRDYDVGVGKIWMICVQIQLVDGEFSCGEQPNLPRVRIGYLPGVNRLFRAV